MFRLFYQYLVSNKKACIPGIGIFSIERKPARLDFTNKVFVPPVFKINFLAEGAAQDARFYKYIAATTKTSEAESIKSVNDFTSRIKENIAETKSFQLPSMGRLFVNDLEEFQFEAEPQLPGYFTNVAAQRVVRQNAEHTILVGDSNKTNTQMQEQLVEEKVVLPPKEKWWIAAVILAVVGISFIVYYYVVNGSLA